MGKIKHELYTFGKAEVTASMGSAVDFGLAFMLSDIVGIYYGLANALGVAAGGVTNCCLNYRYVFGDSNRRKKVWHGDISSYGPSVGYSIREAPSHLPSLSTVTSASIFTISYPRVW